ncbi:MAG: hypothetical protein VX618_03845 [Thermodesulfobacteriota bacterium]|nr:hypothetical protein [Thermodesulfobacteriota bacterium]
MREINLDFVNRKLEFETNCDDIMVKKIENYINDEYRKLKLEPNKFSQSDISILLLINSVFEVLSLTEEKNENFKRIESILSKI